MLSLTYDVSGRINNSEMSAFQAACGKAHVWVDMRHYNEAAVERTMKIQAVILQALAKKIYWWQAAEIYRHQ